MPLSVKYEYLYLYLLVILYFLFCTFKAVNVKKKVFSELQRGEYGRAEPRHNAKLNKPKNLSTITVNCQQLSADRTDSRWNVRVLSNSYYCDYSKRTSSLVTTKRKKRNKESAESGNR